MNRLEQIKKRLEDYLEIYEKGGAPEDWNRVREVSLEHALEDMRLLLEVVEKFNTWESMGTSLHKQNQSSFYEALKKLTGEDYNRCLD